MAFNIHIDHKLPVIAKPACNPSLRSNLLLKQSRETKHGLLHPCGFRNDEKVPATMLQHCRELAGVPATILQRCRTLAQLRATMLQHCRRLARLRATMPHHCRTLAQLRATVLQRCRTLARLRATMPHHCKASFINI
ncbi:MAG: hypothetical protein LBV26_06760 [Bacteroidales bacterium]|nr:hypothetical protein [Bacteroidales bacterium]